MESLYIVVVGQGAEQLPLIKLHPSLSFLSRSLKKTDRQHDLVISVTTLYFPFGFRLDGILLKPTFWFLFPYSNKLLLQFGTMWTVYILFLSCGSVWTCWKSYALGELVTRDERISTVRQLWSLTRDLLVSLQTGNLL
jgi:hypothetical protein